MRGHLPPRVPSLKERRFRMVHPTLAADRPADVSDNAPMQVWGALALEQQERVIRLMAHLACALATAPIAPPRQEPRHADPSRHR